MDEIEDSFLLCKICFEIYKRPKTLVCLHVFCEECIEKTADAEFERSYRYMLYSRTVTCPICRKKTELPGGGVRRLPDNFLVANLTDVLNRKKPTGAQPLCEICKPNGGRSNIAISKCLDCSKVLCKTCVDLHRRTKVTASHGLYDIEVEKNVECKTHPDEVVRFYCEPCEKCICVVCTFQEHKGHDVSSFTEGMQKYAHSLDTILSTCKERMTHLREQIHLISTCEQELKVTEEHIHDVAIDTIGAVRRKEKEMIDSLQEVFGRDTVDFFTTKEDLKDMLENIQSTCSLTEIILKDKSIELLLLRKEIQQKLEGLITPALEPPPENLSQQVKFVPGSLTFGYLDVDGRGKPEEFKDIDYPLYLKSGESVDVQTDSLDIKESSTTMGQFIKDCFPKITQTDLVKFTEKATSPKPIDCKSEAIMVLPDVRDSYTMTPCTPTTRRRVQTEHVVQTTQSTTTVQADISHRSTNTLAATTSERSTLTKRLSFIDEITDTGGLVMKRDQETLTPLRPIRSAGTLTDFIILSNKGTSTIAPDLRNKITSTPRLAQTTRETMTPYIAMLDMGVTAKMPGIDKASATKTTIMSDSFVIGGDIRTRDIALDTPFESTLKLTVEHGTMPDLIMIDKGMRTEACVATDKDTFTNYFNMTDKYMETDSVRSSDAATSTVKTKLTSVGVETIKRKTSDKGVHVQEKVAKLETKTCPTQTTICLHHYIPLPNSVPCTKATNTIIKNVKSRETSTLQVQLKDCGTGTCSIGVTDMGVGEGNVYTSSMGINTLKTPTSSKGITTIKLPTSTKGTTTVKRKTSNTSMVTDQVITKDSSHGAFRGILCDADSNTDMDVVVKPAVTVSDMATSIDVVAYKEKGVGTLMNVSSVSTETSIQTKAMATNTTIQKAQDFGTTMSSNVNTCDTDTSMPQVVTKEVTCGTVPIVQVTEATETWNAALKDTSVATDRVEMVAMGVGSPPITMVESSTYMPQPLYRNRGVNPEPIVTLEKLVGTPTVELESRGTAPTGKFTFSKGTETNRVETRSIKTLTKIPVLEKATYMPQTITISTGTSAIAEMASKTVGTVVKDTYDSGTMTLVKRYTDQDTSMGRGVKARHISTDTQPLTLVDTASDAVVNETFTSATNTPAKVYMDMETSTPEIVCNTTETTTQHRVTYSDQSTGTPSHVMTDMGTDSNMNPSKDNSTMTHIKTKSVGVIKRPHTVTRGMETAQVKNVDSFTEMPAPYTKEGQVMTDMTVTADKGINSKPFDLVSRATGTLTREVKEMSTGMVESHTEERCTSPIPMDVVDRQCSPLRTLVHERQSSPICIPKSNKKVGVQYKTTERSTSTIKVNTRESFTGEPLASVQDRQCSPISILKGVDMATSPIPWPTIERETSPLRPYSKDGSTITTTVETTDRESTPIRVPTRNFGVHVGVMMETKSSGTPTICTSESTTEMPHITQASKRIATLNTYTTEKETSTPQIHQMHKNVSTENTHTLDASTSTPIDIVASYLGAIKPEKAITVTRGTATEVVVMESKELSPIRGLGSDKASSPVRILTLDKAVNVSGKGEIMEPVDKFQKVGLNKGRPSKPIVDKAKLAKLACIEEDAENRSSGSEDENIIGGFGSLPNLPMFPRHQLRPRPNLFTENRPQMFNLGPKHTEKFWPSSPRLGSNRGLGLRPSSMFNVETGRGSPSSILMKVEMGTNTSSDGVFTEDRGTSTPPIDKLDKASCTESLNVDGRMAECISKLKTVRQRLEQSPTYSQANSPNRSPTPRMLSPPVLPTTPTKEPPRLQARSKSVGDGLDESDYSPFVSPLPLRKANAVLESLSESSDSDKACGTCPAPPQSPRTRQALARKQRLDLSQMLRSASMPESEHPPFSPMPKPKIHRPKVIPPLDLQAYKPKVEQKGPTKKTKPKKATRTITKFSLAPQIEEEHGHSDDTATEKSRKETQREKMQSQLPFAERRTITRTLLHPIIDSGSSSGSDSSGARSPSTTFRNLRQKPEVRINNKAREAKLASTFKNLKEDKI